MAQQLDPAIFGARPKNLCAAEGCTRPRHQSKALCVGHLGRRKKGKPMAGELRPWKREGEPRGRCSVGACARPVLVHGRKLCSAHYRRLLKGKPLAGPIAERRQARMVNFSVRIDEKTVVALVERAEELRVPQAALARRVLEDWAKAMQRRE